MNWKKVAKKAIGCLMALTMVMTNSYVGINSKKIGMHINVYADTYTVGNSTFSYYFLGNPDTGGYVYYIIGYEGTDKEITIPEYIDGIPVVGIEGFAFDKGDNLETIIIPKTVTDINGIHSRNLKNIYVDEENSKYKSYEGVLFTKDMKTIVQYPRKRKNDSYTIPNGVSNIGESAFSGCNITNVEIPEGVINIGYGAFENCFNLTDIELPDSVKDIGNSAFYNCSRLESINTSNNIGTIGSDAFNRCKSLKSIEIPNNVEKIEHGLFYLCESLTSVKFSDNLKSIGESAFDGCGKLSSIKIPDNLENIYDCAFMGCISLESIYIPDSVNFIDNTSFEFCENLKIYGKKATYAEEYANENDIPFVAINSLSDDITNIEIEYREDIISSNVSFKTKQLTSTDEEYNNIILKNKTADSTVKPEDVIFTAYDVSLVDENNTPVQPTGTVIVKIPCPADYNGENCKVYRVEENGEFTDMNAEYQNGYMVFETDHFSTYIITETELITGPDVVKGDANGDGKMDIKDSAIIKRYLAGWDVEINMTAADMDGDGKVTIKDSALIKRQLAGWE